VTLTGAALGLLVVILAGCGGPAPGTPNPTPALTPRPASTSPISPSPRAGAAIVDPSLLDGLPPLVERIALTPDVETAAEIAATIEAEAGVEAIAVAIYPSVENYAVVTVARLRPEAYDEDWFRDWRETFDEGVCQQAGGVDPGHSEIELAGRHVFRSTCVAGVVIHHVWLPESRSIVSIQGAGPLELGRRVLEELDA
jgi:hypothetical protein